MVWLCLYALFLNQLAQQFNRLLHPLHGDVLIRPMEGVAAGAQVGAGQPHEAQPCAVGAASDGFHHRRQPHRFRSGLGVVDEVDVLLDDFRHVLVLILDAPLHRSFSTLAAWSTVSFRTWNPAALWSRRI